MVTNGSSFSHPKSVGTILGIFTLVALIASFATAIYGASVSTMRLHYAHSLSVGVVFAVFQHIYFTGALSVNWPSVLVGWWSNFAWASGMIYSSTMQSSINNLIGTNVGNTSEVGAAPSGSTSATLGGGIDLSAIYRRTLGIGIERAANHPFLRNIASEIYGRDPGRMLKRDLLQRYAENTLQQRDALVDASSGYKWYGKPVSLGLPLPGNYSGFAGTLAVQHIQVSNAFMTGFLWFLILLVIVVAAVIAFKWILEGLIRMKSVKQDRLKFFRDHWLGYTILAGLRTCFIAFFMIMFLTIFQFTYSSSGPVKGVAALVFVIFLLALSGAAACAIHYKKNSHLRTSDGTESKGLVNLLPGFGSKRTRSGNNDAGNQPPPPSQASSRPFWKRPSSTGTTTDADGNLKSIHDDEDYTTKFGWLASRFRRTRWWFFAAWLFYEFVRAAFYGAASGFPMVQVFGLLAVEFIAFMYMLWVRPFEGRRLNILVVYCLGFSKVATVALSAAFNVQFNLSRIITTAVGIVIIVIQGILTIITLIAIILGAISSYMSVSRNKEDFRPRKWHNLRERYFNHLDRVVDDVPQVKQKRKQKRKSRKEEVGETESTLGFEMKNVRRMTKIEDEDEEFAAEMRGADANASGTNLDQETRRSVHGSMYGERTAPGTPHNRSRPSSIISMNATNLPYGARPHRQSWSTREFSAAAADPDYEPMWAHVDMNRPEVEDEPKVPPPPALKGKRLSRHSRSATALSSASETKSASALALASESASESTFTKQAHNRKSTDNLHDNIDAVPEPTMRARSHTFGSRPASRASLGNYNQFNQSNEELTGGDTFDATPSNSKRNSLSKRKSLLTPAQELEEWPLPPLPGQADRPRS